MDFPLITTAWGGGGAVTEASALATAPVAVLGARLPWAPRDPPATLLVRAADLAAAAAADAGDVAARTLDMLVGDGTVGP